MKIRIAMITACAGTLGSALAATTGAGAGEVQGKGVATAIAIPTILATKGAHTTTVKGSKSNSRSGTFTTGGATQRK